MTKHTKTLLFTLSLIFVVGIGALLNMSFSVHADDLEQRATRPPRSTRAPRGTRTPTPRGFVASPTPTPGEPGGVGGGCGDVGAYVQPNNDYAFLLNNDLLTGVIVNLDDPSDYMMLPEHTLAFQYTRTVLGDGHVWTLDTSDEYWACGDTPPVDYRAHLYIWDMDDLSNPVYSMTRIAGGADDFYPGNVIWSPDGRRAIILADTAISWRLKELLVIDFEDDNAVQYYDQGYVLDARWHSGGEFLVVDVVDEERTVDENDPIRLTYILPSTDINWVQYWLIEPYNEPAYIPDDGRYLINNYEDELYYLDCCNGESYMLDAAQVGPIASPDNSLFASVIDEFVMVWDGETLEPINAIPMGMIMDNPTVQWSDDSSQIAIYKDDQLVIMSAYAPEFAVLDHSTFEDDIFIRHVYWNDYGDQVILTTNELLYLWDLYLPDYHATFAQAIGLWQDEFLVPPRKIEWAWDDSMVFIESFLGFDYLLYVWDLSIWDAPQTVDFGELNIRDFSVAEDATVYAIGKSALYEITQNNPYAIDDVVFDAADAMPQYPPLVPYELWGFDCPGTLPTQLAIGQRVMVITEPWLRGRSEPSVNAEIVGNIHPYKFSIVADGPVCADGYVWWNIHYTNWETDDDFYAWAAESGDGEYWIGDYEYVEQDE